MEDTTLQETIKKIQAGDLQSKKYQVIEGRLWSRHRLVIPKSSRFIPVILQEAHD